MGLVWEAAHPWTDYESYDATMITGIRQFALSRWMHCRSVLDFFLVSGSLIKLVVPTHRILYSGRGRSAITGKLKPPHGLIKSLCKTDGCPPILAQPSVSVALIQTTRRGLH